MFNPYTQCAIYLTSHNNNHLCWNVVTVAKRIICHKAIYKEGNTK